VHSLGIDCALFEPLPTNIHKLKRNISINAFKIPVYEFALVANGAVTQQLEFYETLGNRGASSYRSDWHSKNSNKIVTKVNAKTFDEVFFQENWPHKYSIFFMKIDVEGMEGEVLNGASAFISKYRPYIVIEWRIDKMNIRETEGVKKFAMKFLYDYEFKVPILESGQWSLSDNFNFNKSFENVILVPKENPLNI
jgi:FkbM family methyltransferase